MTVTREDVIETLSKIVDPGQGKDLIAADMAKAIMVSGGTVSFVIEVDPAKGAAMEPIRAAAQKVSASVVTILTTGGIRHIEIPANLKKQDDAPERPRDARRPVPEDGDDKKAPGGKKAPHFENPWQKMLAPPGFKKAEGPSTGVVVSKDGYIVTSAWNFESKPNSIVVSLAVRSAREPGHLREREEAGAIDVI